jgi:hypothetical protein
MPATRKQRSRSNMTMRAGASKPNSMAPDYGKFISYNLKKLDDVATSMEGIFTGKNPDFIKKAGLLPAQKKLRKLYDGVEGVEKMLRANKHYNRDSE